MHSRLFSLAFFTTLITLSLFTLPLMAQDTIAPPGINEQTKGTPAVSEEAKPAAEENSETDTQKTKTGASLLGSQTKITEYKRKTGQVYRVELEHSAGNKQYIEETDSDGVLESKNNDIEDTPNLPKWKIGSW